MQCQSIWHWIERQLQQRMSIIQRWRLQHSNTPLEQSFFRETTSIHLRWDSSHTILLYRKKLVFTISLHQQDHTAFFPLDNWEWNISLNNSLPLRPPLPSPLERILFKSGKIKLRKFSPLHPQIEREQNCKVINMDCLSGRGYVNVVDCHTVRSSRHVCVCCGGSFHIHCCRCSPGYTAQRWQRWLRVISFRPSWG